MATPSLFPLFTKAQAGGGTTQIIIGELLVAMPDDIEIAIEEDLTVQVTEDDIVIVADDPITIEVE